MAAVSATEASSLSGDAPARDAVARVPRELAFRLDALPLELAAGVLTVGLPDGDAEQSRAELARATRLEVRVVRLPRQRIREQLRVAYEPRLVTAGNDDAPAIRSVDALHDRAIRAHASDVHLEPDARGGGRVRLRVDGLLRDAEGLGAGQFAPVVSRIKLLAGMDIADRRLPQDGRYAIERDGRAVDARVSSIPTLDGEKVVIRLLDPVARGPRLDELGMAPALLERYRAAIAAPFGFIVVTGPTGSGKTTTLYGSLAEIGAQTRSVCSVEDPVEMRIAGVAQVHVNTRAGLTFPVVLRALLRQDPNVIMIGEMRDRETTDVGISAALSGQLVLTTLHAADSLRTVDRLLELGAPRHAIASALTAVVSQRLARRLCEACRREHSPPSGLPIARSWIPHGCEQCEMTGYRGRVGLFELFVVDDAARDAISEGLSSGRLAHLAAAAGYRPMLDDGLAKVAAGLTSVDEVARVAPWPR